MELLNYPLQPRQFKTRAVKIGNVFIGGDNPVCIQSMLSSPAYKLQDCIREIKSLDSVNCELIRLTIPSRKELDAISEIRRIMREEGINRPLIADIHFSKQLAVDACELFEKIRINPGNYSDTPKSSKNTTNVIGFEEGREKLKEAILPLAKNLKKYNRALRIGVNQGSLSQRMIERHGDSPLGMVNSALELTKIFDKLQVQNLVVSLKSSNPVIALKAYRLFVEKSGEENPPAIHLGVTEAGNGLMGRIKSLTGIGVLLADGVGDTIRVSLTEEVANEVIFAQKLLKALAFQNNHLRKNYQKAIYSIPLNLRETDENLETLQNADYKDTFYSRPLNHQKTHNVCLKLNRAEIGGNSGLKIGQINNSRLPKVDIPFDIDFNCDFRGKELFVQGCDKPARLISDNDAQTSAVGNTENVILFLKVKNPLFFLRRYYKDYPADKKGPPIGMIYPISDDQEESLCQNIEMAAILSEGMIDYLIIPQEISAGQLTEMLCLLQASRSRIFVTDYIICPSCGRTQFDIQAAAEEIKKQTNHLKGIKIGIMGCVVNGPGEMADADFGYVGNGADKVDLYCGQERVCRGVHQNEAVSRLIRLIKDKGKWRPPN